jgi:hypothetical protein
MDKFTIDKEYQLNYNFKTNLWDTFQNGELLPKNTDRLFKYYPLNLYSIDSLLRSYFYLSNPGQFNDPFDCNINLIEDTGELRELKSIQKNSYKNIGICAFSEEIDNHLMWAHYTNNYNGFALEFKGDKINIKLRREIFNRFTLTRVIYPEKKVKIRKEFPFAQHYLLTTKFRHWRYEKEWRIVAELTSDEREMEYYRDSIKAIYIGHKIPDENKSVYKMLLEIHEMKIPNIPIYIVYPHQTDLKLKFEKVWG